MPMMNAVWKSELEPKVEWCISRGWQETLSSISTLARADRLLYSKVEQAAEDSTCSTGIELFSCSTETVPPHLESASGLASLTRWLRLPLVSHLMLTIGVSRSG